MMRPPLLRTLTLTAAWLVASALAGCPDDPVDRTPTGDVVTGDTGPVGPSGQEDATAAADVDDDTGAAADTAPVEDGLTITSITPERGLATGLDQVEILGTGFAAGMQVYFGESLGQDTFVLNAHRIIVLTPPRTPGLVDVKVVEPETGRQAVLEAGYLYFNPVQVHAVDPPTGHVLGGEAVTIEGLGFREGSHVVFGQTSAVSVEVLDDGHIQAVTPAGVGVGPVDVFVSNDQGIGSLRKGFLYVDAPRINAVVPPVGLVAGGGVVELKGVGFYAPVTAVIGGRLLGDVTVVSDTVVRGTVPAAAGPGPADVLLTTSWGTAAVQGGYTYLDSLDPGAVVEILNVTPPAGPARGGNRVTLVAKGLTTKLDTAVTFAGVEATVVDVDAGDHTVIVEAPAGAVGVADVSLTNGNGSDTAAGAYTYEPFVRVYEVIPNFGPTDGGTAITITGEGFTAGATVRIGALPAAAVQVVDASTLTAVTPPGSPGLANITVQQAGLSDTLVGGFAYQAPLSLWVVTPPQGSQAGGTLVSLVGTGFPSDARVEFGGRGATHVDVVSPTLITCKTPPGDLGTVDVKVRSTSRGQVLLPDSFTYYDPESTYGGTWGQEVDGDVNVTVLDAGNGGPIPDAFVMLWTDPHTPYQGFTNLDGQITFSGDDLAGEQMATASKEGYSSASVVEYDATNLTIYLMPTTPPSPGSPPSVEQPYYRGTVTNLGKSVPIPWGQCALKTEAPAPLCDPCTSDDQCGAGYRCSDLPDQGSYCTLHCATSANCPDGFMCFPLNGVVENQCVPVAGEVTAFCDFTNGSIFSQDLLPDPGLEATPDLSFEIPVPLGEFAVYCWGGIIDREYDLFTPYALGVDRHVFANPGDLIEGEIRLAHPLNRTYTIRLDDVPRGPEGPDLNVLFRYLDLGGDGVITFLDQVDSWGSSPFVVDRFLGPLSGDLYDASFTFMAGSFSLTSNFLPYTMTLHQNITSIENDTMYYLEDGAWTPRGTGVTNNINALWRLGAGDTVGVGTEGLIIRSLGTSWAQQPSQVDVTLNGVHGVNAGFALAVGNSGAITRWDGFRWSKMVSGTSSDLRDVWVGREDFAVAVGYYSVVKWDGTSWKPWTGNTSRNLNGVWGFGIDDIWAVANYGQIIHWDGTSWNTVISGTTQNLRAVWGVAADDLWMVGEGGTILHWDGTGLTKMAIDSTQTLTALWGDGPDDVTVVGARGTAFHWDGAAWTRVHLGGDSKNTTLLAIGGDPGATVVTGAHELILGPMLAVPENLSPADGGLMGDEYRISWGVQPGTEPHFNYVEVAIPGLFGPTPEWTTIADYDVTDVLLPDLPNIEGTPGITPGQKILTIFRVYKEGFDIDNYSNQDLNQFGWRSWSVHQTLFTKQ
ncbi:MAG: hypothetical protein EP329_11995 [Deltaproteobacteria bacterium]|nr:MAG: hypothetical protein EP329_11995 [Deltaproteobacteria bacterium]